MKRFPPMKTLVIALWLVVSVTAMAQVTMETIESAYWSFDRVRNDLNDPVSFPSNSPEIPIMEKRAEAAVKQLLENPDLAGPFLISKLEKGDETAFVLLQLHGIASNEARAVMRERLLHEEEHPQGGYVSEAISYLGSYGTAEDIEFLKRVRVKGNKYYAREAIFNIEVRLGLRPKPPPGFVFPWYHGTPEGPPLPDPDRSAPWYGPWFWLQGAAALLAAAGLWILVRRRNRTPAAS